jgi:curved DNA-binding protein CbpA
MTDHFETLGIPNRLVISENELNEAFREAGKTAHPDAGGGEGDFSKLREAHAILSSPSKRLKHWLDLRGMPVDTRGVIDGEMMDLFGEIGAITQSAETLIRKRDDAKSALARALMESQTQQCRETVEVGISRLNVAMEKECTSFPEMETGLIDLERAAKAVRNLAFLEKWKTGLRSCYSRLV